MMQNYNRFGRAGMLAYFRADFCPAWELPIAPVGGGRGRTLGHPGPGQGRARLAKPSPPFPKCIHALVSRPTYPP